MGIKRFMSRAVRKLIMLTKEEKMIPIPEPVNTNRLLEDKIALITGGSGGIGMGIAKAFLNSGAKVIIAGTNENKLNDCLRKLTNGGGVKLLTLNVLDVKAMPGKVEEAANLFGENRIDILVNSAGVVSHSGFENMTEEEYDNIMNINVRGTYFMSQAVSKFMIERKIRGHILNLASSSSLRPAWTPYQISKWAVRGLTLGLADSLLPHGIIVNAIAPGPVATPMLGKNEGDSIYNPYTPTGRYAMPSEIAELAVFMASSMGDLIVGDTFFITGGSGTITLHR
ncbi:MAG: SDR family oxidoreductase [Synergistaceae bacterium]|nr:SDR family oxidoreductase [Synergistaceae bacterium]